MSGEEDILESLASCSYCQQRCTDEIKCLPCGYAVCSSCSARLRGSTDAATFEFKCQACGKMHEMPRKGLELFVPIMRRLKMKLSLHQSDYGTKDGVK